MIMDHTVNTWKIQIKMKIFNICYQIPGVKVLQQSMDKWDWEMKKLRFDLFSKIFRCSLCLFSANVPNCGY